MKANLFNSVKMTRPKNNVFDLSHDVKFSANMGYLVPTMALDTIPGDRFNIGCESLLRFQPLVAPVMHRFDVTMHYFFVPNRLVWPNWENYITNTPASGPLPAFPTLQVNSSGTGNNWLPLMGYMGIPKPTDAGDDGSELVSAIPFAAYQMIYNEYYRDQNLVTAIPFELVDGGNDANLTNLCTMRKRAWEHDYFTAALPFAQKGAAVDLPIGNFEDVGIRINNSSPSVDSYHVDMQPELGGVPVGGPTDVGIITEGTTDVIDTMYAKTSDLQPEATTINDLRRAFRLQEWLEKAARGGSRYVENILAFFGVRSQDMRLQRPEYITGTKSPVTVSEVLNTTGTTELPQGNMSGHALSVTSGKYGYYECKEHGYIIGIMSVMPKTAYQQGIPKHFLKINDPFEFYWPQFAHIGEQEVEKREVYAFQGTAGQDIFGYVPRYAEYKFVQNRVAGDLANTLDFWHEGRIFASAPSLNQEFVECTPDHRIFAVTDPDEQKLICHVLHKIRAIRPMPKFGTPTF